MPAQTPDQSFDHATFLKNITQRPGVYQMFDAAGQLLYIGKAKNLKNRLGSYFQSRGLTSKTLALVARIHHIEVTVTTTETEAMLLEHNLIKQNRPPYNILLRDDKSYPYIFLSDDEFPRLACHRGSKREKGSYYGPYPSASSVRESLNLLQRIFKVRQCEESNYRNRSRPCLQYQIRRCTAPCVNLVSREEYAEQVRHTRWFLEGKSDQLAAELARQMEAAAAQLEFERAAEYRDQIQHLQRVTETQYVEQGNAEVDVIAASCRAGMACVHVLFIRGGRILGSRSYYPALPLDMDDASLLAAFIGQYYLGNGHEIPARIICGVSCDELVRLSEALSLQAGKKVQVLLPQRGRVEKWVELARVTAAQNLKSRLANKEHILQRFEHLQQVLGLDELPERIECFDISHSSGEATVASCVVFDQGGPVKSDYRRFNIDGVAPGDDYAAMAQALERRFRRLVSQDGKCPDILLIDGGKGQVAQAARVLDEFGLGGVRVIGVAKGPSRRPGLEQLVFANCDQAIDLPADAPALHLIQQVRDESHRFAVKGHTQRRDKKRRHSALEDIPGVGVRRRKELLHYFGSAKGVMEAPVRELIKVQGISEKIAEDIYATFHKDE